MRILHISDTHGLHRKPILPEADVLVHSGDFTFAGAESEAYDFMEWLIGLPYANKVFIAGNHDDCMFGADSISGLPANVHYLCNSGVTLCGISFYGVPLLMGDILSGDYDAMIGKIPDKTDVLITHQPPFGILDGSDRDKSAHYGDRLLLERVGTVRPKLHLFGHNHNSYGTVSAGVTIFSNAAVLDNGYNMKPVRPTLLDV